MTDVRLHALQSDLLCSRGTMCVDCLQSVTLIEGKGKATTLPYPTLPYPTPRCWVTEEWAG